MSRGKGQLPLYDRRRLEQLVMQHRLRVLLQQKNSRHAAGGAMHDRRGER